MAFGNRIRVAGGVGAIWTDPSDTLPFTDPNNHLERVKFHSALGYIKIISETTVNLSLPSRDGGFRDATKTYQLFQHGRGARPGVFGAVPINGELCAFAGSVPVQFENTASHDSNIAKIFARLISIGADATWVYAYEFAVAQYSSSSFYASYDAVTIPLTIYMTDQFI